MRKSVKVCVVGAANIDLISYVDRLPTFGETMHGSRFRQGYGGKGANQAVMAARLGAEVTIVTKVGRDDFGDGTLANLRDQGVDTAHVGVTDEAASGVAPIFVDPAGHNAIVIVTGANDLLTEDEIEAARPTMAESAVVVCQLEIPVEITTAALRVARAEGARTVLNPAPARDDLPEELFGLSDVLCPNQTEAALLTGRPADTVEEATEAAGELRRRGASSVVVTLGEAGCLVADEDGVTHVEGMSVDAVDTTGAGDAYVGALACCLAGGLALRDAARLANQVASWSVQGRGTQTSFPSRADLPAGLSAQLAELLDG